MDPNEYRYTSAEINSIDDYESDSGFGRLYNRKRVKRIIFIRKSFNSYENAMDTLSILLSIDLHELSDIFYRIDKIITKLSIIEIDSIIDYLKKNLIDKRTSRSYFKEIDDFHIKLKQKLEYIRQTKDETYFKEIDDFHIKLKQKLEYIRQTKDEILLTNFISYDVMVNVLFEYICYKKLMIYFSIIISAHKYRRYVSE